MLGLSSEAAMERQRVAIAALAALEVWVEAVDQNQALRIHLYLSAGVATLEEVWSLCLSAAVAGTGVGILSFEVGDAEPH